jgi:serine/threonine-protein kinase
MVTGQPPFPGTNVDKVLRAHLKQELTPPDHLNTKLSAGIGEVVEIMMAKDRQKRYQTPGSLLLDLESLLAGQPPKVARQSVGQARLEDLAEGEPDDEEDEEDKKTAKDAGTLYIAILAGFLALSVLLNLFLVFRQ